MSTADPAVLRDSGAVLGRLRPALRQTRRLSRKNPTMVAGIAVVLAMIIIAAIAPLITTYSPRQLSPGDRLHGPSGEHWFGTDNVGRDIYARTIYGTRISLQVGFAVAILTMAVGSVVGLVAGYYRKADMLLMRVMDGLMAIPNLFVAIALMALLGASVRNIIIALLIAMTPRAARVVRASVLSLREEVYVGAAKAIGAPDWRIIAFHIFPGTIAPLIIQGTYTCAVAILVEASLSFLGAGVPPDVSSWGIVMAEGRNFVRVAIWMVLFPGTALFLMILGVNLAGDGLRDILDPKLQRRE